MSELKPCPFCGGEAIGFEWSDDEEIEEGEPHRYDAYCAVKVNHKDNCVLEVGEFYCWVASSEEEAAVLWNRRAEQTCLAKPYEVDGETGFYDCIECECGEVNDVSARYCNGCGGLIEVVYE